MFKINKAVLRTLLIVFVGATVFLSCSDDEGGAPVLDHVSIIPKDSTLQSADRGDMIVIFGSNLASTKAVYFNGLEADLNPAFITDRDIIVRIPSNAPYINADNKIRVVTDNGATEINFVLTQAPVISSYTGVAENGATISIKGSYFLGLEEVGFINADATTDTLWAQIVDVADDEIHVVVPEGTKIATIYVKTGSGATSTLGTFGMNYIIYADKLADNWQNWSWSSDMDFSSTSKVKSGEYSWKQTYTGGWGGIQMFGNDLPLKDGDGNPLYSTLKFSIYGGPGTTDKEIIVTINWGAQYRIKLEAGKWTDYALSLSNDLGSPDKINVLVMQDVGNTGVSAPYLMFIDDMGLQ